MRAIFALVFGIYPAIAQDLVVVQQAEKPNLRISELSAPGLLQISQDHFWHARFKEAAAGFEHLSRSFPTNAEFALWLGRTYDRQASIGNPISAPKLVGKARQQLRRAVSLDPHSQTAIEELIASYAHEGGDTREVSSVLEQLRAADPMKARYAEWLLDDAERYRGSAQGIVSAVLLSPARMPANIASHVHRMPPDR